VSRGITTAASNAAASDTVRPVWFFEGEFSSGYVRLWTGLGDISWDSKTWQGVGNLGSVDAVRETAEIRAEGINLSLSGIPSDIVSKVLTEARTGKPVNVWLGLLTSAGTVIADPIDYFQGRMDVPTIEDAGDTSVVRITAESRLISLERPRIRRYTDEDQQSEYSGDKGFEHAATTFSAVIPFGNNAGRMTRLVPWKAPKHEVEG